MKRIKQCQTKLCTCGKSNAAYDGIDITIATSLLILAPIVCGVLAQDIAATLLASLILASLYLIYLVINKLRGHSLSCAWRKSLLDMDEFLSAGSSVG